MAVVVQILNSFFFFLNYFREIAPRVPPDDSVEEGVYSIGSRRRHLVDAANSYCVVVSCMVLPFFSFFLFRYL